MNSLSSVIGSLTALFAGLILMTLGNTLLMIVIPLEMDAANYTVGISGTVMAAYFLGFAGGAYYGQHLILQVGHIRTFACFATFFSATVVAYPLLANPLAWGLFRFSSGFCVSGIFLVIESWLNDRAPVELRAKILGVYTTLTYAAQFLGLQLVKVMDLGDVTPYLYATLLLSFSLVPVVLTKISAPNFTETQPLSLGTLARFSPLSVAGTLVSGIMVGCFYSLATIYVRQKGYSISEASNFSSSMVIGALLFLLPVGWLTDRFDRRRVLVIILSFTTGVCLLMAIQDLIWSSMGGMLFLVLIMGASMASIYPIAVTQAYDYLEPSQYVAAATGLFVAYALGSFFGPLITGILMSYTRPEALFVVMGMSSGILLLFTLYRIRIREALPVDEQETVLPIVGAVSELEPRAEPEVEEEREIWEAMREQVSTEEADSERHEK